MTILESGLPVLRDAETEEARIGCKDVRRQRRIVRVEERARYRRRIEQVLDIGHRLPAVLIGEDQSGASDDYEWVRSSRCTISK